MRWSGLTGRQRKRRHDHLYSQSKADRLAVFQLSRAAIHHHGDPRVPKHLPVLVSTAQDSSWCCRIQLLPADTRDPYRVRLGLRRGACSSEDGEATLHLRMQNETNIAVQLNRPIEYDSHTVPR